MSLAYTKFHKRQKILGVNIDFGLTMPDVIKIIDAKIKQKKESYLVATTNPYFIMSAQSNKEFKSVINKSLLSIPDGIGVLYAEKYTDYLKKNKIKNSLVAFYAGIKVGIQGFLKVIDIGTTLTGVELTDQLFKLANDNKYTVFILGGRLRDNKGHGVSTSNYDMASDASRIIKSLYPNIRIVGATSAYNRESSDDERTVSYIHKCMSMRRVDRIDILLVAYNPILQELWINRNAHKVPSTVSVGIGRTLDYITGNMKKAPEIYDRWHLSWLYALYLQPWRFVRVIVTMVKYPWYVHKESVKKL